MEQITEAGCHPAEILMSVSTSVAFYLRVVSKGKEWSQRKPYF